MPRHVSPYPEGLFAVLDFLRNTSHLVSFKPGNPDRAKPWFWYEKELWIIVKGIASDKMYSRQFFPHSGLYVLRFAIIHWR